MKYFTVTGDTTPDDLRRRYRELCKLYHPDKGGDKDIQAQINAEYEQALQSLSEMATRTGNNELLQILEQHLKNLYSEMKTPVIKKYVPEKYQGLAMEMAKLLEVGW